MPKEQSRIDYPETRTCMYVIQNEDMEKNTTQKTKQISKLAL